MAEEKRDNGRDPIDDLAHEVTGTEENHNGGRDPIDDLVDEITGHLNWDAADWQNTLTDWQGDEDLWEEKEAEQLEPEVKQPSQDAETPPPEAGQEGLPFPGKPAKKRRRSLPDNIAESIIYAGGVLLISFIIATVGWRWANDVLALDKAEAKASVTVEAGDSIGDIADQLKEKGLIRYKYLFQLFAGITNKAGNITAGSYELSTEMDYSALLNNIGSASAYRETVTVTIPEGYTVEEVFQLMEDKGVCDYDSLMYSAKTDAFSFDFLTDVKAEGAQSGWRAISSRIPMSSTRELRRRPRSPRCSTTSPPALMRRWRRRCSCWAAARTILSSLPPLLKRRPTAVTRRISPRCCITV